MVTIPEGFTGVFQRDLVSIRVQGKKAAETGSTGVSIKYTHSWLLQHRGDRARVMEPAIVYRFN
ncbi:hypothetical protein E2C01_060651 [Portunus trituberculatus]|uniref:Uncharacterized protein n=1 Tax=Portunus trituberculatus TaxID=210409 RepID=A0A5B7H8P9_PORTR|nr:hypothetical protein [Portunus trituberculatus]